MSLPRHYNDSDAIEHLGTRGHIGAVAHPHYEKGARAATKSIKGGISISGGRPYADHFPVKERDTLATYSYSTLL
jgi:hypothetical protein